MTPADRLRRPLHYLRGAADRAVPQRAETTTATTEDAARQVCPGPPGHDHDPGADQGCDWALMLCESLAERGLLARPTPSRDQIANALAVTDVHHPDYCDCTETENCHGLDDQVDAVLALLEGGTR